MRRKQSQQPSQRRVSGAIVRRKSSITNQEGESAAGPSSTHEGVTGKKETYPEKAAKEARALFAKDD